MAFQIVQRFRSPGVDTRTAILDQVIEEMLEILECKSKCEWIELLTDPECVISQISIGEVPKFPYEMLVASLSEFWVWIVTGKESGQTPHAGVPMVRSGMAVKVAETPVTVVTAMIGCQ